MLTQFTEEEQKNNQDINLSNKQKKMPNHKFQMINFFDLDPQTFQSINPYNLDEALEAINSITPEKYKKNYFDDYCKKDFEFKGYEEDINFSIDNISFLTSTIKDSIKNYNNDKNNNNKNNYEYISLVNLVKKNCIIKQTLNNDSNNKKNNNNTSENNGTNENDDYCDSGISLKITNKDEGKKEIIIKCIVNPKILEKNIIENLIQKSPFPKAKTVYENILKYRKEFELYKAKSNGNINLYEFDIKIQTNSLNKIIYNKKGLYILDLQHPPNFRTNFLIDPTNTTNPANQSKNNNFLNLNNINNYNYYENIIFPFRNFKDEISNLKYRHFHILIEKRNKEQNEKKKNNNGQQHDNNEELIRILAGLFKNYNEENDETKFIYQSTIPIYEENDFKTERKYLKYNYELSDYFKYEKNLDIKQKLNKLKFIKIKDKKKRK